MRIAVVGGNGFIGKEFVSYSKENGHYPVVIGSDYDVFSEIGIQSVKNILKDCEAMVLLAAKRSTKDFSVHEYIYNITLAGRYLHLANEESVSNIVIASSISVYSSMNLPWRENEFQTPLSLYGASKQAIDSLALWFNANKGMKIKSLRFAQVIGMGERKGYLLNTLIDNAMLGKKQIIYGQGIGKRQYIYIRDVCDAILHGLVNEKDNNGIFNIGMQDNVSILELAEIVNEVFKNRSGIEKREDKPEDTKAYLMDISRTEKELHWKPQYDLKKAFMEIKEQCQRA